MQIQLFLTDMLEIKLAFDSKEEQRRKQFERHRVRGGNMRAELEVTK